MTQALDSISFTQMDGRDATLADYAGSVVLIVNVASQCGLTPQYEALQTLYQDKRDQGLVVLAFPANNFGGQEPGTNDEIKDFCSTQFGVEFPLAQKVSVKGGDIHPLFAALIDAQPTATANQPSALLAKLNEHGLGPERATDVMWNFEKFLIDRSGQVVARFAPDIPPADARLLSAIEAALDA
ncbi:MAG: glutathione peroxidase [Abyssibacter sp.]|uniref:glutathione peroxidase n=1 Tax=Abyssibacter sp. TaxID=2320200 RepID=UPI00321A3BEE